MKKIAVAGTGYVGLSVAAALAQHNDVTCIDVNSERVDKINNHISPIREDMLVEFIDGGVVNLKATTDVNGYKDAEFVFIAVPTNYDPEENYFDCSIVRSVIDTVTELNPEAFIIIKSTIPVGFVKSEIERTGNDKIMFSPEFLREGRSLDDNLEPSRIIIGYDNPEYSEIAENYLGLMSSCTRYVEYKYKVGEHLYRNVDTYKMSSTEAECVKLFANSYMAMRVAFFNELDMFAEINGLDSRNIINGVCSEPRIGHGYNNPSFGYGGYCFPKDTKQLVANYDKCRKGEYSSPLIHSIVESNQSRFVHIAIMILKNCLETFKETVNLGVYKLAMKSGSDNFRENAIEKCINELSKISNGITINYYVYEPTLKDTKEYNNMTVINDLKEFKNTCDVIICNRYDEFDLDDVKEKVYTRDIFGNN